MFRVNQKSTKAIIISLVTMGIILCVAITACGVHDSEEDVPHQWQESDIYGKWKCVRLVEDTGHSYGWLPLGNEIGRTLTITETQVIDSKDIKQAEKEKTTTYDMEIASLEMTMPEDWVEIQLWWNIGLNSSGMSGERIYQYVIEGPCEQYAWFNRLTAFSYDDLNPDKIMTAAHWSMYLFERYTEQRKGCTPYGKWYVERLTSRGEGEAYGIDFFHKYGNCYEITKKGIREGKEEEDTDYTWKHSKVDREQFEAENNIVEGLGLENEEIEVWYGNGADGSRKVIIPIDGERIIMEIDSQWFVLQKVQEYKKLFEFSVDELWETDWKYVQLLHIGEVDKEKEGWDGQECEIPVSYYAGTVHFYTDPIYYSDGKVPELVMTDCTAGELKQKLDTPEYFDFIFKDTDKIHVVEREIDGEIYTYVMLDSDTMLRYRNGLWYLVEKQTKKLNWENQRHE